MGTYGTVHGLRPVYKIFNYLFRETLTPKKGDRSSLNGTSRNILLALSGDEPISIGHFMWTELSFMLRHGSSYVIYAPYIQRIIKVKTRMDFQYDGIHSAYTPQAVRPPPPPARAPSVSRGRSPPPESSQSASRRRRHDNLLKRGLRAIFASCRRHDDILENFIKDSQEQFQELRAERSLPPARFRPIYPPSFEFPEISDDEPESENENDGDEDGEDEDEEEDEEEEGEDEGSSE